jgi:hypothetical protein
MAKKQKDNWGLGIPEQAATMEALGACEHKDKGAGDILVQASVGAPPCTVIYCVRWDNEKLAVSWEDSQELQYPEQKHGG